MSHSTFLMIKVPAEHADAFVDFYVERRILDECKETIPGLIRGELLKSSQGDGQICVLCQWTDKDAYNQWLASPVRAKQSDDAMVFFDDAGFTAEDMHTLEFDSAQAV
ncbi:antibiotic biosynthesis monooxygenase family protein [Ruegeria profundi]|nr:antibiotic biosynthesis monooxygenase family protein [Ruegeria profundi]